MSKVIRNLSLGWTATIKNKTDKFSPNGKVISEKQIASLVGLGIDVSAITSKQYPICTINVGSGYGLKNMTLEKVKNTKAILEKYFNKQVIDDSIADESSLPSEIRTVKRLVVSPVTATLSTGEVIQLSDTEAYSINIKLPDSYKSYIYELVGICGYPISKYDSTTIKVGCHYHKYVSMIDFLSEVIKEMEEIIDAQANN